MSEREGVPVPNPENLWVCCACYRDFEHVAFLPNSKMFCLIKHEGKFHFVGSSDQGHAGCIWLTFEVDPFVEPDDESDAWDRWHENIMDPFVHLDLSIAYGYECYDACLKAGYDPENEEHGHVYYWLAKWAGQAVADFKAKAVA